MYGGQKQKPRLSRKLSGISRTKSADSEKFVYFLSVLSELDILRHDSLIYTLKKHSNKDANNTFLFVAYPRGENGFSQAVALPESELKALGRVLREEIGNSLMNSGIYAQAVDLMLSRPAHPPLYTQYNFSAKEKLELYRLPAGTDDIIVRRAGVQHQPCSPYLLFRHNDHDIRRIFARCLLRDVASVFQPSSKYSSLRLFFYFFLIIN